MFDLFAMLFPAQPQQIKDGWIKQKKQLLEDVRASGAAAFWQAAVSHLASITIVEGELEKAESLLKELPQHSTDSTSIWAMLFANKAVEDFHLLLPLPISVCNSVMDNNFFYQRV